jgi:hypothetical protein
VSAKRRLSDGIYFRLGYTWAQATDTAPDALTIERSPRVENATNPRNERARSVTDQRHRLIFALTAEPRPFDRAHPLLMALFHDWKFGAVVSGGSGRPVNGEVAGDANRDGNFDNDRLPGAGRNAFTGPNYISADLRITRRIHMNSQWRLEASVESFNVLNRNNKRIRPTDDGYAAPAGNFVPFRSTRINGRIYPGFFERAKNFLKPQDAYAPRQIQLAMRIRF